MGACAACSACCASCAAACSAASTAGAIAAITAANAAILASRANHRPSDDYGESSDSDVSSALADPQHPRHRFWTRFHAHGENAER